jgi:hypothetical protein
METMRRNKGLGILLLDRDDERERGEKKLIKKTKERVF